MNEETQKIINESLVAMIQSVESVKDFTIEHAPDVIQQLLIWNGINSFLGFLMSCICLYFMYRLVKYQINNYKNENTWYGEEFQDNNGRVLVINMIQIPGILIVFETFNLIWLKILVAPNLYLIEYAAQLIQ